MRREGAGGDAAERRRDEILAVAAELFGRRGYAHTSLVDLADQVGLTGPALYHYFASKEQILFEVRVRIVERSLEGLRAAVAGGDDPLRTLGRIYRHHLDVILDDVAASIVFEQERGLLSSEHEAHIERLEREYQKIIRDVVVDGIEQGYFRDVDPKLVVGTGLAACNWVHRLRRPPRGRNSVTTTTVELLLAGIVTSHHRGAVAAAARERG